MADQLPQLLKRLETVTIRLEELATKPQSINAAAVSVASGKDGDSATNSSPSLRAYQGLLDGPLASFLTLSKTVGGAVADQSQYVKTAFDLLQQLLVTATKSKKPSAEQMQALVKPISEQTSKCAEIRDKNRPTPVFNHLAAVSEGLTAMNWVIVEPAPAPFIGDLKDSAQFYLNRVLKEFKEKDKNHVEWVHAFVSLLVELQAYVKKNHTTGLVWNPQGGDAAAVNVARKPASPPQKPASPPTAASPVKPSMGALFGELNKGGEITSGLKKVEKSQMTHKNPELRASSVVKAADSEPVASAQPVKSATGSAKKPPKLALEGHKWVVENYDNNRELIVETTELKQVVYIYNCNNSVIQIKGKVNAVIIDNCKKLSAVVDGVVSSVEVVNSKSAQVQIIGKAPTASINKTDGLNLFLSKECLDIEIFTAKSSEINVTIPAESEEADPVEKPVPEQMKTVIRNGTLVTEIVEHKG